MRTAEVCMPLIVDSENPPHVGRYDFHADAVFDGEAWAIEEPTLIESTATPTPVPPVYPIRGSDEVKPIELMSVGVVFVCVLGVMALSKWLNWK